MTLRNVPTRLPMAMLLVTALVVTGCQSADDGTRQYSLTGQILALRPDTRELVVKHGDIAGFMPAMTMTYTVREARLLQGRTPGDLITATLVVEGGDAPASYLSAIRQTGTAPLPPGESTIPAAAGVSVLQPGDAVPDTPLQDQENRRLSLADWRGQAVAVTFIYTRCPLPEYCPLLDRRFTQVQARVVREPLLEQRVRLLSVSFDPDADTPDVLQAHARTIGADPTRWRLATAPRDTVDRFAATFGVTVVREADRTITHSMRTTVIAPDGRVQAVFSGASWTADELVDALRAALDGADPTPAR